MPSKLITLWENAYGCAKHYRRAMQLYLLSMLSQSYYVIIDRGVSATGHVRYVVDGLNTTEKYVSVS